MQAIVRVAGIQGQRLPEKVGAGPSQKWRVRWDKPELDTLLNACSLTSGACDLETAEDDNKNSSCNELYENQ